MRKFAIKIHNASKCIHTPNLLLFGTLYLSLPLYRLAVTTTMPLVHNIYHSMFKLD